MTRTVSLRCRCGAVRGQATGITPAADSRAVCYCDDCQIYALHLGTPGVLDERGGTDACLLAPAQVTITQGRDQVRCVRLSPKGLYRWYAGCCKTPLGNTLGPGMPVVVLVHNCMDHAADGRTRDEDLGPPKVKMLGRFAIGGTPPGAHPKTPLKMIPHFLGHLAKTYLHGRAKPYPFFDEAGTPCATPTVIDEAEREALRARVLAAAKL
ncbi:MAG TPA: DUF6151 family protein [Polyangiales bacterium]